MADVEVSTQVAASPERVWPLIADPTRMGEWSPDCHQVSWIGSSAAAELGAQFRGHNRNGWRRWSTRNTIVSYEPSRQISWDVDFVGIPVSHWSYRIESDPAGAGCRLVESWRDRRPKAFRAVAPVGTGVADFAAHNQAGMEQTLQRIKAAAEQAKAS